MTRDEYLRRVGYQLNDLPWGMRRDLLEELRGHLDELPPGTDLRAQLGPPETYAEDLRAATGLERRRGPIAFLRARRPRNLALVVTVLTVIGLAIGTVVWIDSYQPLAAGDSGLDPVGAISSPTGDGIYVVFHEGKPFQFGTTIRNTGRYTVRVLGVPMVFRLPISFKLFLAPRMPLGGMHGPYRPFHPFDLKPGEERAIVLKGSYDEPCTSRGTGSDIWYSIPVRFGFLWRRATVQVPLTQKLSFVFRKSSACPSTKP